MYCPKCGYSAGENDSFCKMCGCDLSAHTNLQETNTSQQAIEKTDLPSKKTIAGFVHSVADLEERYFTLIESSKKIKDEAIKKRKQADNKLEIAKKELGKSQEKLQARQKEVSSIDTFRKYRKLNRSVGGFFGAFFAFIFIYGFTGALAGTLLSALLELLIFGTSFEDPKFVFTIPILVILFAIYWSIYFALKVSDYKKTLKTQQEYVSNWQKSYSEAVERCKECEKS